LVDKIYGFTYDDKFFHPNEEPKIPFIAMGNTEKIVFENFIKTKELEIINLKEEMEEMKKEILRGK
jgi:hypothetical protein